MAKLMTTVEKLKNVERFNRGEYDAVATLVIRVVTTSTGDISKVAFSGHQTVYVAAFLARMDGLPMRAEKFLRLLLEFKLDDELRIDVEQELAMVYLDLAAKIESESGVASRELYRKACEHFDVVREYKLMHGDYVGSVVMISLIGYTYALRGRFGKARAALEGAVSSFRTEGETELELASLKWLYQASLPVKRYRLLPRLFWLRFREDLLRSMGGNRMYDCWQGAKVKCD